MDYKSVGRHSCILSPPNSSNSVPRVKMRLNLNNKTIKVGLNLSPPYVFLELNRARTTWQSSGGFETKLIDVLSGYFNFRSELINCNSSWGSRLANGSWTGVVGLLTREEADLGIGGITLNYDRSEAVSFLYPHVVSTVTFITPAPKIQPNIYLVFKPLAMNVWLPFIFTLFVAILFDIAYNRVHRDKIYNKVFWLAMNLMFRQQYDGKEPQRASLSIWSTFWALSTFILTTGYAGCLCSLITIPIKMKTIDTCQELGHVGEARKIIITAIRNSAYSDAIKESKLPIYVSIAKYMTFVSNKSLGRDLVRTSTKKSNYAFISTRDYLRYTQLIYGEDIIYVPPENEKSSLFMDLMSVLVRPSFPFVQEFNQVLNNLISAGLINYWKEQEYFRISKRQTSVSHGDTSNGDGGNDKSGGGSQQDSAFSISQLQSFFFVFIFSIFVSFFFFFVEVAHYYLKTRMEIRMNKRKIY